MNFLSINYMLSYSFPTVDTDNFTPTFDTFVYTFTVSGYAGIDTQLGTVNASDGDAGAFGQFTYSLNQTLLPGNYFKVLFEQEHSGIRLS